MHKKHLVIFILTANPHAGQNTGFLNILNGVQGPRSMSHQCPLCGLDFIYSLIFQTEYRKTIPKILKVLENVFKKYLEYSM